MATIVLTETDQEVRLSIAKLCTSLGHTVLSVPPTQSISAFLRANTGPLVIILDLTTWSGGVPLVRTLLHDPTLRHKHRFLLCLDSRNQTLPLAVVDANVPTIVRPIRPDQLERTLNQALSRELPPLPDDEDISSLHD
jgi:CheY-like chemotaxis protein